MATGRWRCGIGTRVFTEQYIAIGGELVITKAESATDGVRPFLASQLDYMRTEALQNIHSISGTLVAIVHDMIMEGVAAGRSTEQITRDILKEAPEIAKPRAATIALGLHEAGVKFVATDMPEANEMVVTIMAAVAQAERRMISERTKAALQVAKARGVKLGNPTRQPPKATPESRAKGSATTAEQARLFAERLRPVLTELEGLSTRATARELERRGIATARGGKWTAGLVSTARKRLTA